MNVYYRDNRELQYLLCMLWADTTGYDNIGIL